MILLFLVQTLIISTLPGQGGLGSVVLPGNNTCANEYIYISPCNGVTSIIYNGNTYELVEIGGQCWFRENLKTIKYSDGSPIGYPGLDDNAWE